jgi:hypothetical protein
VELADEAGLRQEGSLTLWIEDAAPCKGLPLLVNCPLQRLLSLVQGPYIIPQGLLAAFQSRKRS